MDGADDNNSKIAAENVDKNVELSKEEEETIFPKQLEKKNIPKRSSTEDEEVTEDSPIMGVLTPKPEDGTEGSLLNESVIKKAIWAKADHFVANADTLTLAGVRRLLEEDLGLDKNAVDPFKKFISLQLDQVLNQPKEDKSSKNVKKKTSESSRSKQLENISDEEGSSGNGSDEMEDEVKPRKEAASRRKTKISEEPKKRKRSMEGDPDVSSKKQTKLTKRKKEEDSDSDGRGSVSDDDQSQSSVKKTAQRKESAPIYGKKVEHLKSIIKACGMSVAPTIYKKAKQVPESKREALLVNELEAILTKEGLSKNPSEKEIKDCKKRKETARELEGIDMSNIISSGRRRSTFSFATPPKPEKRVKADKVVEKESKNKENSDKVDVKESKNKENSDKVDEKESESKENSDAEHNDVKAEDAEEDVEEEEQEEDDEDDEEEEEEEEEESDEFNEDDHEESD